MLINNLLPETIQEVCEFLDGFRHAVLMRYLKCGKFFPKKMYIRDVGEKNLHLIANLCPLDKLARYIKMKNAMFLCDISLSVRNRYNSIE